MTSTNLHALRVAYGPGIALSTVTALAATFVSEHYGGPPFLYALFFGISFNFLGTDPRTQPGVDFAARSILRFGVALLGVRVSLDQIASLGVLHVSLVIIGLAATIGFGMWLSRIMKRPLAEGLVTGGAVAICGASAALAIAAVLPRDARSTKFTLVTVVGVTLLSTIAMVFYPILVRLANFDATLAGIFLGGTIHDVAQVVGAGYSISPETGDNAALVKLLRVALLLPVVLVCALVFRARADQYTRAPLLPWFLIVFGALVVVSSAGWVPTTMKEGMSDVSRWCLVTAIAALGIKTSFKDFAGLGWRPIALMVAESVFLASILFGALLVSREF